LGFNKVRIGESGEIVWGNIVKTEQKVEILFWDNDISHEFAYENPIHG
jgi:hypothetical protein